LLSKSVKNSLGVLDWGVNIGDFVGPVKQERG